MHGDRVARTLTFWLRPDFVLRVVSRFQKVAGFDRSIALASGALTATIPLMIVTSAVATQLGGKGAADRIIARYELTRRRGRGRPGRLLAAHRARARASACIGLLFLMVAVLSFSRAVQRLSSRRGSSIRSACATRSTGCCGSAGSRSTSASTGFLHAAIGHGGLELTAALLSAPLSVLFLSWGGWILSAKRIPHRELLPFAILGAALLAAYSVGATVYVPHLFDTYATRYGVIGAVFAMISTLFIVMVIVVGSAAAGREIRDELDRIRRGERPAEDEVRRQWDSDHRRRRAPAGRRWPALSRAGLTNVQSPRADGPRGRVTSTAAPSIAGPAALVPAGIARGERRRRQAVGEDRQAHGQVDRLHDQVVVREV